MKFITLCRTQTKNIKMRSLSYALKQYINECYHVLPVDKNNLRLIEEKNSSYVHIQLKDRDFDHIFCFTLDKEKSDDEQCAVGNKIFPFFNPSVEGLCVKNDFILVHQFGDKVTVLLIELKSNHQKGCLNQLKTGKLFFQFIIEKIKLCDSDFENIANDLEYKFILFRKPRKVIDKFNTTQKKKINKAEEDILINYQLTNNAYYLSQLIY